MIAKLFELTLLNKASGCMFDIYLDALLFQRFRDTFMQCNQFDRLNAGLPLIIIPLVSFYCEYNRKIIIITKLFRMKIIEIVAEQIEFLLGLASQSLSSITCH